MKKHKLDVLVVEDDAIDFKAVERALSRFHAPAFALHRAETLEKGKRMLDAQDFDAVILDLGLPNVEGLDSLIHFHANAPETPIVVLTGNGNMDTASDAVGMGAEDFLLKSELYPERLEEKLRLAIQRNEAKLDMLHSASALQQTVDFLSQRAQFDPLTGLPNRGGLEQSLKLFRSQGGRMIPWAMLDMDGLRKVNDDHGRAEGDKVLAAIGRRLQLAVGPTATVVRAGGDEFLILFHSADRAEAERAAERMHRSVMGEPFALQSGPVTLTATMVLRETSADELESDALMTEAREHLALARAGGLGQLSCGWAKDPLAAAQAGDMRPRLPEAVPVGADVVLLQGGELIAKRLRFVVKAGGGFIEDRVVDLARLSGGLTELSLSCVRQSLGWDEAMPYLPLHLDLELDALTAGFAQRVLELVSASEERKRLCFFLPVAFDEEQGERASRVIRPLRQAGFNFGLREVGGGGSSLENLFLIQPSWIRLSSRLCNGVAEVKAKRQRLEQWLHALKALGAPLVADQASPNDLPVLKELGLLGAVLSRYSRASLA